MSQGDEIDVDAASSTDPAEKCVVCRSGTDLHRHTLTGRDGNTHTVSLCAAHHRYVYHDTPPADRSAATADTQKVTARIPTALLEELDEEASELEVPRSELIRDCLREGLRTANTDVSAEDFLVALVEARGRSARRHAGAGLTNGHDGAVGDSLDSSAEAVSDRDADADVDIEFLKERVVKLESLLELALR